MQKGKKLLKDVLLAITWPLEQSIKLVQTLGKFTVPRLLCKTTINTPIGLKPQNCLERRRTNSLGFKKKVKVEMFGKDVNKSKMIFAGLKKQKQTDDMIAYLKTLK